MGLPDKSIIPAPEVVEVTKQNTGKSKEVKYTSKTKEKEQKAIPSPPIPRESDPSDRFADAKWSNSLTFIKGNKLEQTASDIENSIREEYQGLNKLVHCLDLSGGGKSYKVFFVYDKNVNRWVEEKNGLYKRAVNCCVHLGYDPAPKLITNVVQRILQRGFLDVEFNEFFQVPRYHVFLKDKVIDILNGKIHEPHPRFHNLFSLDVPHKESKTAPMFQSFLDTILPDRRIQTFLQEFYGKALMGEKRERILFMVGRGANGKSTIKDILSSVFGKASIIINPTDLHSKTSEDTFYWDLKGALLGWGDELRENAPLDEAKLKTIASAKTFKIRAMYRDSGFCQNFMTLSILTNHLPLIKGTDDGVWRKICILEMKTRIPDAKQDINFANKVILKERAGVLNWLLIGARNFIKHKDNVRPVPEEMQIAHKRYRSDSNHIARWIEKYCTISTDPAERTWAPYAHEHYRAFMQQEGLKPHSRNQFTLKLEEINIHISKSTGKRKERFIAYPFIIKENEIDYDLKYVKSSPNTIKWRKLLKSYNSERLGQGKYFCGERIRDGYDKPDEDYFDT